MIVDQYKTVRTKTGEIKIEMRLEHTGDAWYVIQNGTILQVFDSGLKAKRFFNENLEMDLYIAQSIEDYEVVR